MADTTLQVIFTGVDKTLSSTASGIGRSFSRLGGAVKTGALVGVSAIAGLTAATVGIGAKLVSLGSSAEEMQGKFDVVFGDFGGAVTDNLATFGEEVGRSRFELMGMASTLGDTLKPLGFTTEAAAQMSVDLSMLATDLGSFNDMEMTESLERLQGVLIGNHENALAFGVIINENTLKAELAANGWNNLTGSALEQAKVQARINLLMKGTTDAQGDAARTAGSWANQMRRLKSRLLDAATELGGKLLPALTPLLSLLGNLGEKAVPILNNAFDKLMPFIQGFSSGIREAVLAIQEGDGIIGALVSFVWEMGAAFGLNDEQLSLVRDKMKEVWDNIILLKDQIVSFIEPIIEWVQNNIQLKDVLIALAIVLGGVVLSALISIGTAIAPILLAGAALVGIVALVRTAWEENWGGIQEKTAAVWTFLQPVFQQIITWFQTNIPIAIAFLKDAWETVLLPAIQAVWEWMSNTLIPFITDTLVPILSEVLTVAIQTLTNFWNDTLMPVLQAVWDFLSVDMMPIWEAISEMLSVYVPFAIAVLMEAWEGGVAVMTTVYNFVKDKLGPIFEWLNTNIIQPLSESFGGLAGVIQNVADYISDMADAMGSIEIPDILTPGSPTPFEMGLIGIRNQMAALNARELPGLQANLQGFNQSGQGNQTNTNNNQTFNWNVNTSQFNPESAGRSAAAFSTGGI